VTAIVRTKTSITFAREGENGAVLRHVQVILRIYRSPAEVLMGFDLDAVCVGFDGARVWALPRARRALNRGYNLAGADPSRASHNYEFRLFKYAMRDFAVAVPLPAGWRSKVDARRVYGSGGPPRTNVLHGGGFATTLHGFAKLLHWEAALATGTLWPRAVERKEVDRTWRHWITVPPAAPPAGAAAFLPADVQGSATAYGVLTRRFAMPLLPSAEEVASADGWFEQVFQYGERIGQTLLPYACRDVVDHLSRIVEEAALAAERAARDAGNAAPPPVVTPVVPFAFAAGGQAGDLERVLDTAAHGGLRWTPPEYGYYWHNASHVPRPYKADVPQRVQFVLDNPGQQWRYTSDLHARHEDWFDTAWQPGVRAVTS
jgi:hypothetical protein